MENKQNAMKGSDMVMNVGYFLWEAYVISALLANSLLSWLPPELLVSAVRPIASSVLRQPSQKVKF